MKHPEYIILLFAVLLLFLAAYQPKNAPAIVACPSCPGNMRSSADGMSCEPMCNRGEPGCPNVSIGCPTLAEVPESCATCPSGWHPAGSDRCISEDRNTFISCPASNPAGLANPASVNCVQKEGGTFEIRKDPEGNEYGICHLPDGKECEEWALFRGERCPTCRDYCEGKPHIMCVGTWKISGAYPACTCEYVCSSSA